MTDFHDRSCWCGECAGVYGERDAVVQAMRQRAATIRASYGGEQPMQLAACELVQLADEIERGEHAEVKRG